MTKNDDSEDLKTFALPEKTLQKHGRTIFSKASLLEDTLEPNTKPPNGLFS